MTYTIGFSPKGQECLRRFRKYDQQRIRDAILEHLSHQPNMETSKRVRLRPNKLAEWELRIGDHRVFYDVLTDQSRVFIKAIGYKHHNRLDILGEEVVL